MECVLLNRSYQKCFWRTKNICCYLSPSCKMGETIKQCQQTFHFSEGAKMNYIKESLEKEWGDEKEKK